MFLKWLDMAKQQLIDNDLPQIADRNELSDIFQPEQSHMHYYFSVLNSRLLENEDLYRADDLTEFVHQHALVSENLGEIAGEVFQLLESDPQLNIVYQQADYDSPLREYLQIGGLYNIDMVKQVVAAFQQTFLPLAIAHFTDDTVLADELLVVLSNVQRVFEFAEQENKIVISYLA